MIIEFYEFLFSNYIYFWLIIAVFFLLLEMGSPGLFFFLSFFFGAIFAAFSTMVTESIVFQAIFFLSSSIISFLIMNFWVKKHFLGSKSYEQTNVYAIVGKKVKVIKTIFPQEPGAVKVDGEIWSAKAVDDKVIQIGQTVEIVEIKGVHVIVREI